MMISQHLTTLTHDILSPIAWWTWWWPPSRPKHVVQLTT